MKDVSNDKVRDGVYAIVDGVVGGKETTRDNERQTALLRFLSWGFREVGAKFSPFFRVLCVFENLKIPGNSLFKNLISFMNHFISSKKRHFWFLSHVPPPSVEEK